MKTAAYTSSPRSGKLISLRVALWSTDRPRDTVARSTEEEEIKQSRRGRRRKEEGVVLSARGVRVKAPEHIARMWRSSWQRNTLRVRKVNVLFWKRGRERTKKGAFSDGSSAD
jgi:hypothetical protein